MLSRSPQNVNEQTWYYEEPRGMLVVREVRKDLQYVTTEQFLIPWDKIRKSLARKDHRKTRER